MSVQQHDIDREVRRQFILRCLSIERELGKYATPWTMLPAMLEECVNAKGQIPSFENLACALEYDLGDLAAFCKKNRQKFEEMLSAFGDLDAHAVLNQGGEMYLTPFQLKIFLPTPARRMGAISARSGGKTVVLWEDGSFDANSDGPLPDVILLLRAWLTVILCPEKSHETMCALLHRRDLCICELAKIMNLNWPKFDFNSKK